MKVLSTLSAFLTAVFLLAACEPEASYVLLEDMDGVISADLIDYDNPSPKTVRKIESIRPFEFQKVTVIETLDEEKLDEFLDELSKTSLIHDMPCSDSPYEICLRLTYSDESFLVYSGYLADSRHWSLVARYNADGDVTEYIGGNFFGGDLFTDLLNKYFTTQQVFES